MSYEALAVAKAVIGEKTGRAEHALAIVLGSGLSGYAATLPGAVEIPYRDIPGFPTPKVEGHAGSLFSVELAEHPVMILAGRVHTYEGWDLSDVVFAVRTAVLSGCSRIALTNAAGGVGEGLEPGDLVLIRDHINLTGRNPLTGLNDPRLGPRFPDMSEVYPAPIRRGFTPGSSARPTRPPQKYRWRSGSAPTSWACRPFRRRSRRVTWGPPFSASPW